MISRDGKNWYWDKNGRVYVSSEVHHQRLGKKKSSTPARGTKANANREARDGKQKVKDRKMQHKRRKKEGDNDSKIYDDTGEVGVALIKFSKNKYA